jgi:serine O-acetyltransferase
MLLTVARDRRRQPDPRGLPMSNSLWTTIVDQATRAATGDAVLASSLHHAILEQRGFSDALAFQIGSRLAADDENRRRIGRIAKDAFDSESALVAAALLDLQAVLDRDPAAPGAMHVLLHYKGYIALEASRVSHWLWSQGRRDLALYLHDCSINALDVSIHPSAVIGPAVVLDHGLGIIIGRLVVIGDEVTVLQNVTIGREAEGAAPRIGRGVLLSSGATILGGITIGDFAKIGAGSMVTSSVPSHCTAVGVPARLVNCHSEG